MKLKIVVATVLLLVFTILTMVYILNSIYTIRSLVNGGELK